jgi:hypothetical protein
VMLLECTSNSLSALIRHNASGSVPVIRGGFEMRHRNQTRRRVQNREKGLTVNRDEPVKCWHERFISFRPDIARNMASGRGPRS